MCHDQNNLASETKPKGSAFQMHKKYKSNLFHGEMETILFGGTLKHPYTIWTNTTEQCVPQVSNYSIYRFNKALVLKKEHKLVS